ncbi:hypothetical protein DESC_830011 [Desulfosarcina cetonica]|nr:hypothetical protein DESC_830011 [Desulfosarcina cetonica]
MAETPCQVVVDHPGGLQKGIADGAAHEGEAFLFECLADRVRKGGGCRDGIWGVPMVLNHAAVGERPNESIKRSVGFLQVQEGVGVGHGGADFESVADDGGVLHRPGHFRIGDAGHPLRVEIVEHHSESLAPVQDGAP